MAGDILINKMKQEKMVVGGAHEGLMRGWKPFFCSQVGGFID